MKINALFYHADSSRKAVHDIYDRIHEPVAHRVPVDVRHILTRQTP